MTINYQTIEETYKSFYKALLEKGKLPLKDTGKGFWNAADTKTIYELLSKIGRHNSFIDLGSGDGKVVLLASMFAKKAVGIEYDPELHSKASEILKKLNARNTQLINDDFKNQSIKGFDYVFLNPDKPLFRDEVEKKLHSELTGKLILFGPHFHPMSLNKVKEFFVNDIMVSIYENPK
ncbi:hypothetical protein ACFLZX_01125 [Nanoarchaeota archaeon]